MLPEGVRPRHRKNGNLLMIGSSRGVNRIHGNGIFLIDLHNG